MAAGYTGTAAVGAAGGLLAGITGGSFLGTITGGLFGSARGVQKGQEIVGHDRGASMLNEQLAMNASAQRQVAGTVQMGIAEQAQMRQHQHEANMVAAMAGPQIQSQGAHYMGRMNEAALSQAAANDRQVLASEAGHAASVEQSQLDAAHTETQM